MSSPKTIGFPRMMKEPGEKRVFLPEFIQFLTTLGFGVFVEEGYGSRSGLEFADYCQTNKNIRMCSREEAFAKDIVLILRSPKLDEIELLPRGTCLISMMHFPTRPRRVEMLCNQEIRAISLDSIVNDSNIRLVENMKAVAWNGLEATFDTLENCWPELVRPDGEPLQVLILGTGMVGKHAVDAACKLGNIERNNQHMRRIGPGVVASAVGRNLTAHTKALQKLFARADIVVDATQRRDTSVPVVPNEWLDWLPVHAVITDLAVDPYTLNCIPPVVRGVEGIPQGNLDQYIFFPNDPKWDDTVPATIPSEHRRTVASCYSWPGLHPEACMRHYAQQLIPLMEVLAEKDYADLTLEGGYFERALQRATLTAWIKSAYIGATVQV